MAERHIGAACRRIAPQVSLVLLTSLLSILGYFFINAVSVARLEATLEERTKDIYTNSQAREFSNYLSDTLARLQREQENQSKELNRLNINDVELRGRVSNVEQELMGKRQ